MSKKLYFPISYVTNFLSPRAIFSKRKDFNLWQNLLIIIFLNALIMIPVTIHYASMNSYPISSIIKDALSPITEKTYIALTKGFIKDNTYKGKPNKIVDKKVAILVLPNEKIKKEFIKSKKTHIILDKKEWIFVDKKGRELVSKISVKNKKLVELKNLSEVRSFVNQEYFNSNRASILMFLLVTFTLLIYVGTIVLIGLGTIFLYLTKKSKLFSINSFSECFGLMVNCLGSPTIAAVIFSIFIQNPVIVMNVQVFGTILMLTLVFYKTHFRDII